jgi:uncharacterized protein (TIGR03118 family)
VKSFSDPEIPRDFTTYGIQAINGEIWVTFTPLNKGGFVDVFATDGTLLRHDAVHGPLHSPWGIAQAPADFGPMSNAILIRNNISRGRVNAFDPKSGGFLGPLRDADGNPIEIDIPEKNIGKLSREVFESNRGQADLTKLGRLLEGIDQRRR